MSPFDLFADRIRSRAQMRARGAYRSYEHVRPGVCSLQHDQNIANADGATVRVDLNNALGSLFSLSSGASAPATTVAYQLWADTTNNLLKQRNAANTGWLVRTTLAESFVLARSANTIIGGGDFGRTLNCTGTFSQTLTAAATLGDGFMFYIRNNGTGVITIDPSGAETIDGATTIDLGPGESCIVFCNGTLFITVGRNVRRVLTADTNFYVRTDGSDSNNGLANTAAGAWLTLQKAWNAIRNGYDLAGFKATVNIGDGTYANFVAKGQFTGSFGEEIVSPATAGAVLFTGNLTTPANVVITTSAAAATDALYAKDSTFKIEGVKFVAAGSGISRGVAADNAYVTLGKVDFGACTFAHMHGAGNGAVITGRANYNISATSTYHALSEAQGAIQLQGLVINLGGAFTMTSFVLLSQLGLFDFTGASFTGTGLTGKTYDVTSNAVLVLAGVTLPGSVAGTTGSGGQVI